MSYNIAEMPRGQFLSHMMASRACTLLYIKMSAVLLFYLKSVK